MLLYRNETGFTILFSVLFYLISTFILISPPLINNNDIVVEHELTNYSFISKTSHHKIYYQGNFSTLKYGEVLKVNKSHCFSPHNFYNNSTSFNFKHYLIGKKVNLICQIDDYKVINQIYSLKNLILNWRNYLLNSLSTSNQGANVLISSLIFGSKNKDYSDFFNSSGTSHLLVISGTHIAVFIIFFNLISNIFCKTYLQKQLFITCLLILFSILCGLNIPVLRAVLIYLLNLWLPKRNWFLFVFSFSLLLNPFLFFNNSFILSFFVSFYITNFLYSNDTFTFNKYLIQNLELWFITIPFQLSFNYSLNPLSPILNLFLGPIFSLIIIPITFISFIFPITIFLTILNYLFDFLLNLISAFNFINLHLNKFNQIEFIIYYLLFFFYKFKIYTFKLFLLFLSIFIIISYAPFQDYAIYALDSKTSDSTLIQASLHTNILINTGNEKFSQELTKFLKSKAIYQIDYLILTHDVNLQQNNISYLQQYFKINSIVTPDNISHLNLPQNLNYQKINNNLNLKYSNYKTDFYFLTSPIKKIDHSKNNIFFSNNKNNIPPCTKCLKVITPQNFDLNNHFYYFPEKSGLLKVKLQ